MNYTQEQLEIIGSDLQPGQCLKVIAYAGTGKTSTLAGYAQARRLRSLYVAFNKSVEQAAKSKFPTQTDCRTIHSLAYQAVGKKYADRSQYGISSSISPFSISAGLKIPLRTSFIIARALENWFNSADPIIEQVHLPTIEAEDKAELTEEELKSLLVTNARLVWEKMLASAPYFGMTHSGYLKIFQLQKPDLGAPLILMDEAQDTNPCTWDLIKQQLSNGSRVILVGDPYQQIYSWRAAIDAMNLVECKTLYLTKSFRFGEALAEAANVLLENFFPVTKALVGNENIDTRLLCTLAGGRYTVVARTNAYIFEHAAELATKSTKIALAAGKFDEYLADLLDIYAILCGQPDRVANPKLKKFKNFDLLYQYAKYMDPELQVKAEIVGEHDSGIPRMIEMIKRNLVPAPEADVMLSTCHKAKGMEWGTVLVPHDYTKLFDGRLLPAGSKLKPPLDKDGHPIRFIDKDEINLIYVAITRSINNLILDNPHLTLLLNSEGIQLERASVRRAQVESASVYDDLY